jgi:hypothetical protein
MTISAALIVVAALGQALTEETINDMVVRSDATIARMHRSSFTVENKFFRRKVGEPNDTYLHFDRSRVLFDGLRWNFLGYSEAYNPGPPKLFVNEFNLVCDQQLLEIYYPHEQPDVRPARPKTVHGQLAPTQSDQMKLLNWLDEAAFAFGYLKYDSFIPFSRLLKEPGHTRTIQNSGSDERGLFVDTMTANGGSLRLWFNPDASFLPSGMRLERTGTSVSENRSRMYRDYVESDLGIPAGMPVKSVTYEVRDVKFEPWKDTHVITSFESLWTTEAENGTKAVDRSEVHFSDWNLDPDVNSSSAFRPMLPVPEGTRVEAHDTPSIAYVYHDGRIELDVNESTVAELQKVELPRRPVVAKPQWIWIVIAGVLAFVFWRIRSAQSE